MTAVRERIVIVGGGIAGLTACDALRTAGHTGEIVLLCAENVSGYSRPALSKALLKMDADLTAHELPAATHGADERLGVAATGLDVARKVVFTSDGGEVAYDGLLIATGARARRLSADSREMTLRTIDDALRLREALAAAPSVIVVGGGVLGMEIASGALASGCTVTLVSTAPPMSKHIGSDVSALLVESARSQGLILVETTHAEIIDADGSPAVRVGDGTLLRADAIASAVGDDPDVSWLHDAGILTDGRLMTDSHGRVCADIVAAGDVAYWEGRPRTPLWTSAIEQARVAAHALLSDEPGELSFQDYFWTEQFGHSVKVAGPLPVTGAPEVLSGTLGAVPALLRYTAEDGTRTVIAIDQRIPIPKLRRLASPEGEESVPAPR